MIDAQLVPERRVVPCDGRQHRVAGKVGGLTRGERVAQRASAHLRVPLARHGGCGTVRAAAARAQVARGRVRPQDQRLQEGRRRRRRHGAVALGGRWVHAGVSLCVGRGKGASERASGRWVRAGRVFAGRREGASERAGGGGGSSSVVRNPVSPVHHAKPTILLVRTHRRTRPPTHRRTLYNIHLLTRRATQRSWPARAACVLWSPPPDTAPARQRRQALAAPSPVPPPPGNLPTRAPSMPGTPRWRT